MSGLIRIEDLSDTALVRAYNELAVVRGTPSLSGGVFPSRKTGEIRVEASLSIVAATRDVRIRADGSLILEDLPAGPAAGAAPVPESRIEVPAPRPATEARVSPGIARMRERLGTQGTEELRLQVAADGDAALAAAARREVVPRQEAGGDAAEARANAATSPGDPEAASAVAVAVSVAQQYRDRSSMDIRKKLERETHPQARETLKAYLKEAEDRERETRTSRGAPTHADTAPAPRGKSRTPDYADADVLRLRINHNPKKSTAAARFAHYRDGMTFGEYAAAIGSRPQAVRDVVWDSGKGWIVVEPAGS